MKTIKKFFLCILISACCALPAYAANPKAEAEKALQSNSLGWTVYVDVNFGMRKRSAVTDMNDMHAAMGKAGFEPLNVVAHTENGDLVGYIITYKKR
jgi:hypothetical protein